MAITSKSKKPVAKKPAAKKPVAKKPAARKSAARKSAAKKPAKRADLGAPVDGFFARQPAALRPVADSLRAMITEVVPEAESAIKWGMPFYSLGGVMMCAIGGHKSHVNLILSGPPGSYPDPDGRLSGDGKTGRHLKLTSVDELPRAAVKAWLRTAAAVARKRASS